MKVLVTGGTGFIGQFVLLLLHKKGHSIRCLVRESSDTRIPIKVGAELYKGDIRDRSTIKHALTGMDAVIHLANIYDFWIPHKKDYYSVNVEGTRNVMEESTNAEVSKVIHVSTLGVYGVPDDKPFNENSSPANRRNSLYFETKFQGDQIAWHLHQEKSLPLVVIYPGAVTGPGDYKSSGRYVNDLLKRRLPAQVFLNSALTWVDVRDVAEVIVRALEKEGNSGERYFAGAQVLSFSEFNLMLARLSGVSLPRFRMPGWMAMTSAACITFLADIFKFQPIFDMSRDQMRNTKEGFSADCSKTTRELGIEYRSIEESLLDTIASLRITPEESTFR